ncbi:phosphoadenosine phosphosulfate reductase family protein [Marinobacter sp. OP 3.4]|uniref:phosphoadenosine phosphosulfate reductase family protein n=1 Tax=Marinobacter sp. OP 3.4 TaxID=3076501 RepID=UPI002E203785
MSTCNVISISGGKDSTAMLTLAIERNTENLVVVFADTGHEHPETYEYVQYLDGYLRGQTGQHIHIVRADFADRVNAKRQRMIENLICLDDCGRRDRHCTGYTQRSLENMIDLLHPTGVPFLDLCLWKGRFPSTTSRFCSTELKHEPLNRFMDPLLKQFDTVISWQGVRADESRERQNLPMYDVELGSWDPEPKGWLIYRPIIEWNAEQVFDQHRKAGVKWNPLYEKGMSRVGCMPCIHARKDELSAIKTAYPEQFERVAQWERLVSKASKRQMATFFSADTVPGNSRVNSEINLDSHGIHQIAEWAGTSRGGRQYDLIKAIDVTDEKPKCTSVYGLCE